ncbi:MAG: LysR family transcriptional regulator [Rhodanobacteraceae bacterium]|nr:LysR family transcriptional regulator [Rhodanobacteraceae bacterium]
MSDLLSWYRSYCRVVETGSFSAVAAEFATSQPTISRHIAELERHLDTLLLQRSTRALTPTDDGRMFYEQALIVLAGVANAESVVGHRRSAPSGRLRIACPVVFARLHLVSRISRFLQRHPALDIELVMGEEFADLIEEGIDLAVRIGEISDPGLVTRLIGTTRRITVASSEYLDAHGTPTEPHQLGAHHCVLFTRIGGGETWHFEGPQGPVSVAVHGRLRSNGSDAVREATIGGLGIAVLPTWHFPDGIVPDGLGEILSDYVPRPLPIHAVYSSRRHLSLKVRAMIDFLVDEFSDHPSLAPAR